MLKKGPILFLLLLVLSLNAQNQYINWYFGDKVGLSFKTIPPTVLTDSKMSQREGCSSVSDSAGNLLFYTDGVTVWNKNHDTMENGYGLLGHSSSTQSALIIKKPGSKSQYYIFTTEALNSEKSTYDYDDTGVHYSIVDMALNGGLGELITKNIFLFNNSSEKITAVAHQNKTDIWIAAPKRMSDTIYLYKLTESGLSAPFIQRNTGNISGGVFWMGWGPVFKYGAGQMKFSADGRHLAYANSNMDSAWICLLDFDDKTGRISNGRKVTNLPRNPYGIEFSPNGKFLYVTNGVFPGGLYQIWVDSVKTDVKFTKVSNRLDFNYNFLWTSSMQMAPDGRIYIAMNADSFLSVIQYPDSFGTACKLMINAYPLSGRLSYHGLPNCVQSQIYYPIHIAADTTCWLDSASFVIQNAEADSVLWNFGDGNSLTSRSMSVKHLYSDSGSYKVTARVFLQGLKDTLIDTQVRIEHIQIPSLGSDTVLCSGDALTLNAYHPSVSNYLWNDSLALPFRNVSSEGKYSIMVRNRHCSASDSVFVRVAKKPTVFIGNDTAFCHQFSHRLDAGSGFRSYLWSTGDQTYSIYVSSEGKYSVQVADSNTCHAGDTILLSEIKKPDISIAPDTIGCRYVILRVKQQQNVRFRWSNGDTGTTTRTDKKGVFSIVAEHPFCSNSDTVSVNVLPAPEVNIGPDTPLCQYRILRAGQPGSYLWSNGQTTPSILAESPGIYWLRITRNGCSGADSIYLLPCNEVTWFIPDAFSPDGNNINDEFRIQGTGIKNIHLRIFNAWGEMLQDESSPDPSWDGSYQNIICQQGVYFYIVEITGFNGKLLNLKGSISLLR